MKRKLSTLASAPSPLLLVGALTLWGWSYYRTQSIRRSGPRIEWMCILDRGLIEFSIFWGDTGERGTAWNDFDREAGWGREELDMFCASEHPLRTRLGFGTLKYSRWIGPLFFGRSVPGRAVFVPIWTLFAVGMGFPTLRALKALMRARAIRRGRCRSCGYDLCATPDRCPECGEHVHR